MDAAGRLDPHERDAIGLMLYKLGCHQGGALERDDFIQEAHIALWRTRHSRRPGVPQDAMRVARNAMTDAVRAEVGRREGSRRRMPGERVVYCDYSDARISSDCPESALRAKQALALLQRAGTRLQEIVEALCQHDTARAASQSLGYGARNLEGAYMRKLRALLAQAVVMH